MRKLTMDEIEHVGGGHPQTETTISLLSGVIAIGGAIAAVGAVANPIGLAAVSAYTGGLIIGNVIYDNFIC